MLALYGQKRRQLNETRSHFGRFVSPAVVARLAEHPDAVRLGGEQRTLTLMFCDIRSFTTLSEGLSAVELTSFLNEYLTPMTDAVLQEMGAVDKYMGDAIMAFWNAPLDDPAHAAHAVRAALTMRKTLAELNRRWASRPAESGRAFHEVKFGVGLNTGECCVGNLGSTRRFDYSAIGDEVNIASRLEGASKILGVDIVASRLTRDEAPDFAWLEVDRVLLKGKTRPTPVYALAGDAATAASEPSAKRRGGTKRFWPLIARVISKAPGDWPRRRRSWRPKRSRACTRTTTRSVSRSWRRANSVRRGSRCSDWRRSRRLDASAPIKSPCWRRATGRRERASLSARRTASG